MEFIYCWKRIKFARGEGPLELALRRSRRLPLQPLHSYSKKYADFVGVAGHLQQFQGDQTIMLPCELLAKLLAVTPMSISRYRETAIEDGLLSLRRKHRFSPTAQKNAATEFNFNVRLFDWTTGRQARDVRKPQ